MSLLNQKTINNNINFEGVGLHSGLEASLTIKPAEPNTGIIFKRTDLKENNIIIPSVFNVSSAVFCTTISNDSGASVSTIEHLMGALYGLGIDNALIEINNQEVPILDGSAKLFVEAISKTGIKNSDTPIKIIKIEKRVEFNNGKKSISIEPSKISLDIDF
jgi:UDP-3-O-[3-hydroxymyristoyl] N-acetylglucosamine deacetylase